jgi:protein-S-isoprenylcysteine O-methyltransferase Ste14
MPGIPTSGGPEPAARRSRVAAQAMATVLGALALVLVAVSVALSGPAHRLSVPSTWETVVTGVVFTGVGVLVARRPAGRRQVRWVGERCHAGGP